MREGEADPAGVSSPLAARSRSSSRVRPLRAASPPARVRLPVFRFLCADPCVRPHEPGGPGRPASSADPGWLHRCPAPLSLQASPPLDQVSLASSLSLFLLKRSKACMWRVLLSPALFVFSLKKVQSLHVACAAVPCFVCF